MQSLLLVSDETHVLITQVFYRVIFQISIWVISSQIQVFMISRFDLQLHSFFPLNKKNHVFFNKSLYEIKNMSQYYQKSFKLARDENKSDAEWK